MSQSHTEDSLADELHELVLDAQLLTAASQAPAPVLEPPLLSSVHQLNLDYLELLVTERGASQEGGQLQYLPPRQRATLAALSPRALRAIAEMPYSLYSLGFEEEKFWTAVCATATATTPDSLLSRYARVGDGSPQYMFCESALYHAWHVARTNKMAARVVYAMPYATAQHLARTPPWQIRYIAASYRVLLMPRWPTNLAFWPDLIRFAGMNDARRLQITRLQGTQLIAQELEVACELSRRDPRMSPTLPSPRLRARKLQMIPRVMSNQTSSVHADAPKPK